MGVVQEIEARAESKCELCGAQDSLAVYEVPPTSDGSVDQSILLCGTCREQIEHLEKVDVSHWHCLKDSMWTPVPAVQVMAWRMLDRLRHESWAQELLDILYLEPDVMAWAESGPKAGEAVTDDSVKHQDSNGAMLQAGDTVTLIKDLPVKGGGFTAKRGTAVRNISLVADNPEHIEGRVNGQQIVILTKFVKKSG